MIRDWDLGRVGIVLDMRFSSDYRFLALSLAGKEFLVRVYDYANEKEIQSFKEVGAPGLGHPYPMTFFNGSNFFGLLKKKQVCVYDTQTWREKWCNSIGQ